MCEETYGEDMRNLFLISLMGFFLSCAFGASAQQAPPVGFPGSYWIESPCVGPVVSANGFPLYYYTAVWTCQQYGSSQADAIDKARLAGLEHCQLNIIGSYSVVYAPNGAFPGNENTYPNLVSMQNVNGHYLAKVNVYCSFYKAPSLQAISGDSAILLYPVENEDGTEDPDPRCRKYCDQDF